MAGKAAVPGTAVLLVMANVGSLFDDPENLQKNWLREFYQVETAMSKLFTSSCPGDLVTKWTPTTEKSNDGKNFHLRDGSAIKSIGCSWTSLGVQFPAPTSLLTTTCNSSSRGSDAALLASVGTACLAEAPPSGHQYISLFQRGWALSFLGILRL